MNTTPVRSKLSVLRRKSIVIPTVALIAVGAVGGTVWAASADEIDGDERRRVAAAATEVAGGGEAYDVERSDDAGEAYEVEVRLEDGSEVDVTLDGDLRVVQQELDRDDDGDDQDDLDDDRDDDRDADDRVLTADEVAAAETAAVAAVGGGTVLDLEASDITGVAYEAEVRDADGVEWDVQLGADYAVVGQAIDR